MMKLQLKRLQNLVLSFATVSDGNGDKLETQVIVLFEIN